MKTSGIVAATFLTLMAALLFQHDSQPSAEQSSVPAKPLPTAFGALQPRLSPDGESIALNYQGAIWRLPAKGGATKRLTSAPGFDLEPVWSPDGKYIAFARSPQLGRLGRVPALFQPQSLGRDPAYFIYS